MEVGNVSFGGVVAVSGGQRNMKKFSEALTKNIEYRKGDVMQRDVTSHYKYAARNGLMARAAQSGQSVNIYITGEDAQFVRERKDGWDTLDGILMQLTKFINVDRINPETAVQTVVNG